MKNHMQEGNTGRRLDIQYFISWELQMLTDENVAY